ncbi:MAG TPA: type II toxin-antitoxin system prevent-host-death family antitoxin [Chloroflexota bacterium]|nr:type II toxin-antitoxin system prevent-host-death family antitoxin [Chloroflexota bacterium]
MYVTNYSDARANLAALMDRATEDREEIRITRRGKPDVVLISADDLEGLRETAYLLRSPANAERLLASLDNAARGAGLTELSPDALAILRREIDQGASAEEAFERAGVPLDR